MRKILFYCQDFYPLNNGYANAYLNLIYSLLQYSDDINITVLTPTLLKNEKEINSERLEVLRLDINHKLKFFGKFISEYRRAKTINELMKVDGYELLFIETFDQPFLISFLDKEIMSRTVVRVHSTSETEYTFFVPSLIYKIKKYLIKNIVSKKIKWISSTNSFHIDFVKKYYFSDNVIKIGEVNFNIIPNTIFPDPKFENIIDNGNKLKAIMLGRMEREGYIQKGFEDLFIALNLIDSKLRDNLDLCVIGNGEYKERLIKLADNIECITFLDSINHKALIETLQSADLVILPSRFEGLSMFALEGLATGNVCLFTKTGGLVDLIDGNGYFTEVQDVYSLADGLTRILSADQSSIDVMKNRSQLIYKTKFSNAKVADAFLKMLRTVSIVNRKNEENMK